LVRLRVLLCADCSLVAGTVRPVLGSHAFAFENTREALQEYGPLCRGSAAAITQGSGCVRLVRSFAEGLRLDATRDPGSAGDVVIVQPK
jgi:hypothetical protein